METQDSYWIPALTDQPEKKTTLSEIDFIMKGIERERGRVDEDLFRERLELTKKALSPVSEMMRVKAGSFRMGDTRDDEEGEEDENTVHTVRLTYDYWIGRYPVTFWEYDSFCTDTNSYHPHDQDWGRGARPMINVSWWDMIKYCNWLSEREGRAVAYRLQGESNEGSLLNASGNVTTKITRVVGYRLPTEAEWEYAARGGHKSTGDYRYAGSDDLNEVGWYDDNSGDKTHPVGQKKANELRLHDMSGNVCEWCHDWWRSYTSEPKTNPISPTSDTCGSFSVFRGGSWRRSATSCRVALRINYGPGFSGSSYGFRIARTII